MLLIPKNFYFHYPDMVVRPDILIGARDKTGLHKQDMIMWVQSGNYYKKFDTIKLYFLDFWFCYPRTPKCQFLFITRDLWKDSLELDDKQYRQIVTEKFDLYNLELLGFIKKERQKCE